jgi:glycosyltransferase involved in cell wall biosynthesis
LSNSLKTILFIEAGTSGYGGSFQSLYQTIMLLNRQEYRFLVIFFNKTFFYEKLLEKGVECYYLHDAIYSNRAPYLLKYLLGKINGFFLKYLPKFSVYIAYFLHFFTIRKTISFVRTKNIDVIHLNNQLVLNFMGLFVARAANIPCVFHLRTFNSYGLNIHKISYSKKINLQYVAISQELKNHWVRMGLESDRIKVIYNILDDSKDVEGTSSSISSIVDYSGYKIIYVGRLIECKGITFLLKSLSQLIDVKFKAKLFLVGDGDFEQEIRHCASSLNIEDCVSFLGYQSNPLAFMEKADLLVLPSKEDGFGRVLLEAMSVGTPVIGTRIGGIQEVVQHEVNGLLVTYGDVSALKEAMKRMLEDESLRKKTIGAGFQILRDRFNKKTYKTKLEEIYDSFFRIHKVY